MFNNSFTEQSAQSCYVNVSQKMHLPPMLLCHLHVHVAESKPPADRLSPWASSPAWPLAEAVLCSGLSENLQGMLHKDLFTYNVHFVKSLFFTTDVNTFWFKSVKSSESLITKMADDARPYSEIYASGGGYWEQRRSLSCFRCLLIACPTRCCLRADILDSVSTC